MIMVLDLAKGEFNDKLLNDKPDEVAQTLAEAPGLALQSYDFSPAPAHRNRLPPELAEVDPEHFLAQVADPR